MKERILSSLLTVLAFSALQAQGNVVPVAPRLVVAITIDQLRSDYLEAFLTLYGEQGFKRLLKEGKVYDQVSYNFKHVDRASAQASLYSGTSPFKNGIVAAQWLDRSSLRPVNCVDDRDFIGFYTEECTSPKQLLVSTLTDELEIATRGESMVYAIAPHREMAVLAAGHAADGAYWLNETTGEWCASSYYGECPRWLERYNDREGVSGRINGLQWEPLLPMSSYDNPIREGAFSYGFIGENRFRKLKASPCMNDEVNRLADALLEGSSVGKDEVTDFLSVTYNAGSYQSESMHESYLEMQDTYARLDKDVASLIDLIDKKVGLEHTLFVVTSTGYTDYVPLDYTLYRVPAGEFYINRATALLNMYLMALYGEGQYVEAYHGLQIYLDRKLIEKKQLRLKDVLERSAEFLAELSGVQKVYTAYDFLLGGMSAEYEAARNSYNIHRSGDLLIEVNAGWKLMNTETRDVKLVYDGHVAFPLLFMGAGVTPGVINTPVTTDCIAPTLALLMRIRAPSGSHAPPVPAIRK
ncbi:MAG: alkaline phosphatase family protein [Bacteroidaceae bacterium]|nr:alkaline phosphatase family protein [Bacteroidaceae bacterium]